MILIHKTMLIVFYIANLPLIVLKNTFVENSLKLDSETLKTLIIFSIPI